MTQYLLRALLKGCLRFPDHRLHRQVRSVIPRLMAAHAVRHNKEIRQIPDRRLGSINIILIQLSPSPDIRQRIRPEHGFFLRFIVICIFYQLPMLAYSL